MIGDILDRHVKASAKAWDRSKTVGASEIGQCSRRVWYSKNKQPHDVEFVDDWGMRMRGTVFEDAFWVPAMRAKFGAALQYAGEQQHTFVEKHLSATPDSLVTGLKRDALKQLGINDIKSDCILVECKTIDPRASLRQAKPHHVFQAQVQLYMVRNQTRHKPTYNVLSYTDASQWSSVREFVVEYDATVAEAAVARASMIMSAKASTDMQPEGWIGGGGECRNCPYARACGIDMRNLPFADKPCDPQQVAEISDMAADLRELEAGAETTAQAVRVQMLAIKARLRELGLRKVPGVLTWSHVRGSKRYDAQGIQKAAIEQGIDIEKYARTGEPSDRLTLEV